jgi:hypothetical protein
MFLDVTRKIVGPIVFRDEIKIGNGSRVDGSQKGVFTGVTDGGGRESCNTIGVVRSGPRQVFFCQIPVKILDSIDHGGITLKGDLLF